MQSTNPVIALLLSDLHLSERPPIFRSNEPDWLAAQERALSQVLTMWHKFKEPPVICAGDIFDRWNAGPEIINLALRMLPSGMCAIPGQHDLPHHRYEERMRGAYGTLVAADKIEDMRPGEPVTLCRAVGKGGVALHLHPFPWGARVTPYQKVDLAERFPNTTRHLHLAVVHAYCWQHGASYPDAPVEKHLTDWLDRLRYYDAAVFGDNHKGFLSVLAVKSHFPQHVLNCGTLLIRKSDERDYRPAIGLLHADGSISRLPLDCSQDVYLDAPTPADNKGDGNRELLKMLAGLAEAGVDFVACLRRAAVNAIPEVRELVLEILDKEQA